MPEVVRNEYCEVRGSSIHHKGVFSLQDLECEQRIVEYVGEKITKAEAEQRGVELAERTKGTGDASVFIFTLDKKYDIDGDIPENMARFINHSCDPNCEAQIIKEKIWIIATQDVAVGDELTFDYGFDIDHYEDHPCRCGKANCIGYIVGQDYWPDLKKRLKKKRKKLKKKAEKAKSKKAKKKKGKAGGAKSGGKKKDKKKSKK